MKTNSSSLNSGAFVTPAIIVTLFSLTLSGCVSTRSLIEGLAKTPHHRLQDSERFALLNSYQQDFLYLTETVKESHPEPYAAWSKDEFDREQHRFLETLAAETSRVVFEQSIRSFLSRLRDSHTSAMTSWRGGNLQYPVSFLYLKDTLFLSAVSREEDTTLIGYRVLAFNDIPSEDVFKRFTRFVTVDNLFSARRILQYYFQFPTYHREAGVTQTDTLELTLSGRDGTTQTLRILPTQKPNRIIRFGRNPVTDKVNRPFVYKILKDEKVCYLQYNTMIDLRFRRYLSFPMNILAYPVAWFYGFRYFENFLEDMFEEMRLKGVETLIVDLRGNGGGSSVYGEQLLYYLEVPPNIRTFSMAIQFSPLYRKFFPDAYRTYAERYRQKLGSPLPDSLIVTADFAPDDSSNVTFFQNVTNPNSDYYIKPDRPVFKGNVYFLIGEATYSSAIILSTLIKDNTLFTIVGQSPRGRPSHYGETLVLKLPNSGIVCRISCKKFFRPDTSKDSEDSLYPDVEVWPTFDDYRQGRDPVFDWVLQDTKNKTVFIEQ